MKNRNSIIAFALVAVLAAAMLGAYIFLSPKAIQGSKHIYITVDHLEGEDASFEIYTDQEYLRGAMEQEGLLFGEESSYGLWIKTVDSETADETKQEWWGFTVNGEFAQYGADDQVISDGDVFVFTLNVGY